VLSAGVWSLEQETQNSWAEKQGFAHLLFAIGLIFSDRTMG